MSEGLTPGVFSKIAQYGAIAGSFEAARTTLIDWGINISLKRIQRLTYYFGKTGINLRQSKINSLLDFYHAASHLQDFSDAAFSTKYERQQWFKKARKTLKKGQALGLMRNMDEFIHGATGERLKILVRERNYILKAYRRRLIKYNEVASQKESQLSEVCINLLMDLLLMPT